MKKLVVVVFSLLFLIGCDGAPSAKDPTERGLSHVASAIITAAFIRVLLNK